MEFKDFKKININDNKGFFCGYASVFNITDSYNDVILNGAFKKSIEKNNILLCWQHNINKVIGNINTIREDSVGLYIEGKIDTENIYNYVKNGFIDGLSIGYNVNKYHFDNKNRRILEEIDLKEISIVYCPANKHANITYCKSSEENKLIIGLNRLINIFTNTVF